MRTATLALVATLFLLPTGASAAEAASTLTVTDASARFSSARPASVSLLRLPADRSGALTVTGTITVSGRANLVLWARVDGVDYFSRLPALQGLSDVSEEAFNIAFNAADHTVSELFLDVELLAPGEVSVNNVRLLP